MSEFELIVKSITSLGFPIVCCIGMGFYIKYIIDKSNARIDLLNEKHKIETDAMREAINNNTLVLQRLLDKMNLERENKKDA